ncbi:hypothetical protein K3U93_00410 [Mycobacterium malmoense]|nr:hypothetical protein [Mycobacterium malmoense]QZA17764.1 hypothetical protein K3U93_00410 [Mycobacterium malmoense]UNB94544.1 hypothetical protein H5T25_00415 [Mycobacterium malmoense]
MVVKVGTTALLVGLALALLVYSIISGTVNPVGIAMGVFNLSGFALMYGVICLVCALIRSS